jgi:hypothetical protein
MWRGSGLPSGLWSDLGTELNEPPVASVATAELSGDAPVAVQSVMVAAYGRAVEQAAPAAVEQPKRMLGPDAKLRAEIVAAAREAGADRFPWVRFANLLEGRET